MHFLPNERTALFIDGANLYSASRNLGFDVDYRNLLEFFRKKAHVIRAYYYSAVLETDEYSPLKPLTDWLAYNGYTLVTKPAKEFTDSTGRRRVKGNMDIEVAVDMLELAPRIDHAVLVQRRLRFPPPGRGDAAQGVRVSVVSSIRTSPPMVADELRRQADQFLELAEIAPEFTRRQTEPRPCAPCRCARPRPNRSPIRRRRVTAQPCAGAVRAPGLRRSAPRLAGLPQANRAAHPDWFNAPVPSFGGSTRGCWSSASPPACAAPTAPAGRSPAISPACCCIATLPHFGLAQRRYRRRPGRRSDR